MQLVVPESAVERVFHRNDEEGWAVASWLEPATDTQHARWICVCWAKLPGRFVAAGESPWRQVGVGLGNTRTVAEARAFGRAQWPVNLDWTEAA